MADDNKHNNAKLSSLERWFDARKEGWYDIVQYIKSFNITHIRIRPDKLECYSGDDLIHILRRSRKSPPIDNLDSLRVTHGPYAESMKEAMGTEYSCTEWRVKINSVQEFNYIFTTTKAIPDCFTIPTTAEFDKLTENVTFEFFY